MPSVSRKLLPKRIDHDSTGQAFYLLGKDQYGRKLWLADASWDCGWYWGFGYVQSFERNRDPSKAEDIDMHTHFKNFLMGYSEGGNYVHNPADSPNLSEATFSSEEGWKLGELMHQFYLLKEMAEFCHWDRPGCHVTTSPVDHGNLKAWAKKLNKVMLPAIFAEIRKILSPNHQCDRCHKEIQEDSNWGNCTNCGDDLCPECSGGFDEYGYCKLCQMAEKQRE